MKVKIEGYQAIKDATIEITKGLTAIVGPTNSGKSSIIRAIKGAINNQAGVGFINYDSEESKVTIVENENTLEWIKSKKGPASYKINNEEITKIGRAQNEDVAKLINMEEIDVGGSNVRLNFWDQMEKAFLMDRTPGQLFTFISQSREQDLVNNLNEEQKTSYADLGNKIKNKLITIDVLKKDSDNIEQSIKNLKPAQEFDLETFKGLVDIEHQVKAIIVSRRDLEASVDELNINIQKTVNKTSELEKVYKESEAIVEELNKLKELKNSLVFKIDNQKNTKEYIVSREGEILSLEKENEQLNKKVKLFNKLKENLEISSKQSDKIKPIISRHSVLNNDITEIKVKLESISLETEALEKEFNEIDVCPYCGSSLENGKHNH